MGGGGGGGGDNLVFNKIMFIHDLVSEILLKLNKFWLLCLIWYSIAYIIR